MMGKGLVTRQHHSVQSCRKGDGKRSNLVSFEALTTDRRCPLLAGTAKKSCQVNTVVCALMSQTRQQVARIQSELRNPDHNWGEFTCPINMFQDPCAEGVCK